MEFKQQGRHTLFEWHKKLGHCNFADIKKLSNMVSGLTITSAKPSRIDAAEMFSGIYAA